MSFLQEAVSLLAEKCYRTASAGDFIFLIFVLPRSVSNSCHGCALRCTCAMSTRPSFLLCRGPSDGCRGGRAGSPAGTWPRRGRAETETLEASW